MRFFIEKKEDGENRKRRGRIKQALIVLPVFLCCMLFLAGCGGITDFPEGSPETDSQELSEEEDREEGTEDAEITLGLDASTEYDVCINEGNVGTIRTNLGGKLTVSVELEAGQPASVKITKHNAQ